MRVLRTTNHLGNARTSAWCAVADPPHRTLATPVPAALTTLRYTTALLSSPVGDVTIACFLHYG